MTDTAGQVSDETLAELRRLAAEATPGPWAWDADGGSYMGCGEVFTWGEGVEGGNIAAPSGDLYPRSGYSPQSDMRFIATADPPTVLALLDTVDALRAEVEHGSFYQPYLDAVKQRDAACERLARVEALAERLTHPDRSARDKHHADCIRQALGTDSTSALSAAWKRGVFAGKSVTMRRMSDEPTAPEPVDPYRALSTAQGGDEA